MKTQIRTGVFETNSSSTHSLTLYDKQSWEAFKEGKMMMQYQDELISMTNEQLKETEGFKQYLEDNYPEHNDPEAFTEDDMDDALYEYKREECFYDWDDYTEEYEVLTEEIPDSNYVAVSIFAENY